MNVKKHILFLSACPIPRRYPSVEAQVLHNRTANLFQPPTATNNAHGTQIQMKPEDDATVPDLQWSNQPSCLRETTHER
jgi:hypothetical protein